MYSYIENLTYFDGFHLYLTFENGEEGIVDLSSYIKRGGVFCKFSDIEYFRKVYLVHGVLTWPGDVDIAPETIYSMATGKPLPEWMENEKQEGIKQI